MTKNFQHLHTRTTIPNIFINSTFNSKNVCLTPTGPFNLFWNSNSATWFTV